MCAKSTSPWAAHATASVVRACLGSQVVASAAMTKNPIASAMTRPEPAMSGRDTAKPT